MVLGNFLILSSVLISIALMGIVINRRNLITILLCIELILLASNINFLAFARFHEDLSGVVFVFFILIVAAAEAAIGLAMLVLLFRLKRSVDISSLNNLKG